MASLSAADLECALCLQLLCDPVTANCGHTICRNCLVKSLQHVKKQCPICRTPCYIVAENAPCNVLLKNLAQKLHPEQYAQREREGQAERREWAAKVPVFCMSDPLLPGQPLSLHLFEPRYRLMLERIASAPKGRRRFGYVTSYQPTVGTIGTIAELQHLQPLPSGTFIVRCVAGPRFVINESWVDDDSAGLHYARISYLFDVDSTPMAQLVRDACTLLRYRVAMAQAAGAGSSSHQQQHTLTIQGHAVSAHDSPDRLDDDPSDMSVDKVPVGVILQHAGEGQAQPEGAGDPGTQLVHQATAEAAPAQAVAGGGGKPCKSFRSFFNLGLPTSPVPVESGMSSARSAGASIGGASSPSIHASKSPHGSGMPSPVLAGYQSSDTAGSAVASAAGSAASGNQRGQSARQHRHGHGPTDTPQVFSTWDVLTAAAGLVAATDSGQDGLLKGLPSADHHSGGASSSSAVATGRPGDAVSRHQALACLRTYAVCRIMARHLMLSLQTAAGGSTSEHVREFMSSYGAAPVSESDGDWPRIATHEAAAAIAAAQGAQSKATEREEAEGEVDGRSAPILAAGGLAPLLSYWMASVCPANAAARTQLLHLPTAYQRLWTAMELMWRYHGFGYLHLQQVQAWITTGRGAEVVGPALCSAEAAVFGSAQPVAPAPPQSLFQWLSNAFRGSGPSAEPGPAQMHGAASQHPSPASQMMDE